MDIKADVKSIKSLKDYFFVVPDYQREYVWEADKQVDRFLQDIYDEFNTTNTPKSNYFIGNTIIVSGKDGAFDVVDGQQRLTTIIITLCAIRHVLRNANVEDDGLKEKQKQLMKVVEELLYEYDFNKNKFTPRLTLQYPESKDFLLNLISEKDNPDAPTPSIKKMAQAYSTVLDFLSNELKGTDDSVLISFIGYFLLNVQMVIITPDNLGSALKIFETINERGIGLNAMDLLKNLLFIHAKDYEFEEIKHIWKEMQENISKSGEGDKPLRFLRYFLIARYRSGKIMREDEIYKWMIEDDTKKITKYNSNPINFAKELKKASERYSVFVKATKAKEADNSYPNITGIGYLTKKTSRAHVVLLMAIKDNIDKSIIKLLAQNIESLIFYYAANRTLTKYYEDKFAKWAVELRSINAIDGLKDFLNGSFKTEFDEQQLTFNSRFATKSEVELNPTSRIKYIFGKIDNYIRTKVNFQPFSYAYYQGLDLEHILPQKGENIPKEKFPNEYDYYNTVTRIGNLTLLEAPINQSLNYSNDISSNQWFFIKKNAYLNSNILLTRTFSEIKIGEQTVFNSFTNAALKTFVEWNMDTVQERQEMLRKLILEIWKLEFEIDVVQEKSSTSKRVTDNNSGQGANRERSAWGNLPNEEKYVIAEKMREYYKRNPMVKMSVLADMFAKDMGMADSTPSYIINYWQLKPSIVENPDYSFFGLPNEFFPADVPLPFEENYKGDSNYQYSKVGNLGKYGKFDDRPAKIQAEMRAAKIENRPINFKV